MQPEGGIDARGRLLAARLLRDGVTVRLRVHGQSMWPFLRDGAEVELAPLDRAPQPGDIVLTDAPEAGPRLHRLVRRRPGDRVQTRGDACLRLDPPVGRGAVVGRLRRVRSPGGSWRPCAPGMLSKRLCEILLIVSWIALRLGLAHAQTARAGGAGEAPEKVPGVRTPG